MKCWWISPVNFSDEKNYIVFLSTHGRRFSPQIKTKTGSTISDVFILLDYAIEMHNMTSDCCYSFFSTGHPGFFLELFTLPSIHARPPRVGTLTLNYPFTQCMGSRRHRTVSLQPEYLVVSSQFPFRVSVTQA